MNTSLIKLRPNLVKQATRLLSSSSKSVNDKSADTSLTKKEDFRVIKYDTDKFLHGVSQFSTNQINNIRIETDAKNDVTAFNGVPKEHIEKRRVRIFKQAKNPMQSGTSDIKLWKIEFETRDRWENPLMGWGSTGDPLSNLVIQFSEKEDAISFCVKNGWTFTVDEPQIVKRGKKKTYADNFAWNSRTRNPSK